MKTKDYIVSFRFPYDDFFVRHETNVCASNKKDAISILKSHIQNIEDVDAVLGIVMLYGKPYSTIKIDVPRFKQLKPWRKEIFNAHNHQHRPNPRRD